MYKKKSLGQHFLHAKTYLRAVADAADIQKGEVILEIGPGDGALTRELLIRGANVAAIEKDHRLIPLLQEKFSAEIEQGGLEIIEGDALELAIPAKRASQISSGRFASRNLSAVFGLHDTYKVVGNIPYYITGALLRKFLSATAQPTALVFLIQKEVAERIVKSKKESLLSLSIKAYGAPSYVKTVPRGAFSPAPGVDSAILRVSGISRNNFRSSAHEERFFALLHAGFAQKRKLLRRNLESALGGSAAERLQRAGIPPSARAEDVPLSQWLALSEEV